MIVFELKLSIQACQLLFCLIAFNADLKKHPLKTGNMSEMTDRLAKFTPIHLFSHFIIQARQLYKHGLITEKNWLVTKRGYQVADLIQQDVDDIQKTFKSLRRRGYSDIDQLVLNREAVEVQRKLHGKRKS